MIDRAVPTLPPEVFASVVNALADRPMQELLPVRDSPPAASPGCLAVTVAGSDRGLGLSLPVWFSIRRVLSRDYGYKFRVTALG